MIDTHDLRSRALLALVLADQNAVARFTTNFQDTDEYVETWLKEQGHPTERAARVAPYLRDAAASMTPVRAIREAQEDQGGPARTDL